MHVLHYPRRKNYPDYYCKQNRGSDDPIHHHHVGISVNHLDNLAWEFALPYLQNPKFIREHIEAIKGQVDSQNRIGTLEATLADTKQRIINLFAVAEAATDDITRQLYRERLAALEKEMRDAELLILRFSNTTERNQKLFSAIDRFEAWAKSQQPFLQDSSYEITKEDKRAALLILGVKAVVFPTQGYDDRVQFEFAPPDIQRFGDFNFQ
ncbi:MAG TPA: hypothetical protein VKB35_05250 [Ktedonobacteraceae bacterium]|nr:hypothetical protein [Ktedonobacteraceae bacterium]